MIDISDQFSLCSNCGHTLAEHRNVTAGVCGYSESRPITLAATGVIRTVVAQCACLAFIPASDAPIASLSGVGDGGTPLAAAIESLAESAQVAQTIADPPQQVAPQIVAPST